MAEPMLQMEREIKAVKEHLERVELAIETLAQWLVDAQTGLGPHYSEKIAKILQGEEKEPEDASPEE
jgi:hypothetical protein